MRALWLICGLTSVGLALVGAVLPLVPTVPFLLLAAFCFARSSERLHAWLLDHPRFGPPIADWTERGAIGRGAKWAATGSILAAFGLSVLLGVGATILLVQAAVLSAVSVFIWSRPSV